MVKKTLLETAKEVRSQKKNKINITQEHIDLALAWVKDEVNIVQIISVLPTKKHNYSAYVFLANALKEYVNKINKTA